jgi:hypothetical protein
LTFADNVVAVPEGVVPEIVESPQEIVPPPDTARALFVEVNENAVPAGQILVTEADVGPTQAIASAGRYTWVGV